MEVDTGIQLFTNVKGTIDKLFHIRGIKDEEVRELNDFDGRSHDHQVAAATVPSATPHGSGSQGPGVKIDISDTCSSGCVRALMSGFAKMNIAMSSAVGGGSRRGLPQCVRLKKEFRIDGTVGHGS